MVKKYTFETLLQIPLKLETLPKPSLKDGIINSNENSLNALENYITSKKKTCKSFFLWGEKGSGKSFWLKAWENEFDESNSQYLNLKNPHNFETEKKNMVFFIDNLENANEKSKNKIFEELNRNHISKNTFIFTSFYNVDLLNQFDFSKDFISRLKQGFVYKLSKLSDLKKKEVLRSYIFKLKWISKKNDGKYDFLIEYMLNRLPRELGLLKVLLDNLNDFAIINKKPISISLIRKILNYQNNE